MSKHEWLLRFPDDVKACPRELSVVTRIIVSPSLSKHCNNLKGRRQPTVLIPLQPSSDKSHIQFLLVLFSVNYGIGITAVTHFSDSPSQVDSRSVLVTLYSGTFISAANAFTRCVFPVPGGPYSKILFDGWSPPESKC